MRPPIDLSAHINQTLESGSPADFPVTLKPVFYRENGSYEPAGNRMAVVREDTGEALHRTMWVMPGYFDALGGE